MLIESHLKANFPNIYRYLLGKKNQLRKRMDSRKHYASGATWYRHLRSGSFRYIRPPKLIVKGIDTRATVGTLGKNTAFNGANSPAIILEYSQIPRREYFLGVLNSALLSYYLRTVCPAKLGGYFRFNANSINEVPIRCVNFSDPADKVRHDQMVQLVEQMLGTKRQLAVAKTDKDKGYYEVRCSDIDSQIDRLVYELYGLTDEEIRIVEGASK
ncbi:MAG: hypothetical protein A2Z34_06685 [Planctomycetes bacterium RBG_16_59_8]|nr:MAG: hypothetical protein A2Z34_06685 [Planctomycetes bacterium RBG_16_59_8]